MRNYIPKKSGPLKKRRLPKKYYLVAQFKPFKSLKKIDVLILCNIYPAGEKNIKGLNYKFYNDIKRYSKKIVIKAMEANIIH